MRYFRARRGRVAAASAIAIAVGGASGLGASAWGTVGGHAAPRPAAQDRVCRTAMAVWQCVRVQSSVRFETVTMWANTRNFVSVYCDDGEVATGGGYDSNPRMNPPALTVFQNRPLFDGDQGDAPFGWAVDAKAADDVQLQVFVVCARIGRRTPATR
jgi:hypothetical protein